MTKEEAIEILLSGLPGRYECPECRGGINTLLRGNNADKSRCTVCNDECVLFNDEVNEACEVLGIESDKEKWESAKKIFDDYRRVLRDKYQVKIRFSGRSE